MINLPHVIWCVLCCTLTAALIITEERVQLKPNKKKVVAHRVNAEPFGFLPGANFTLDLDCVGFNVFMFTSPVF